MADEMNDPHGEDAAIRRLLRERLPRHAAPGWLRAAIVEAAAPRGSGWKWPWLAPAAAAVATALIGFLWIAPSLPTTTLGDPVRLVTRAVLSEHARTILWGEERADVVPAALPRAMEDSGVALSWVFTGDDDIQLVNAQPTYLDGRRGIELAYRDREGHTVTYLVLPARMLTLPDRGRVPIGRWRPVVRQEGGFSLIMWKQQELLCVLVSDLVSESDLGRLKQYFIKVRTSTEPYAVY